MSDQNGLRQSPFSEAFATPEIGGTGLNGMGNGLDDTAGPNGITQSPFKDAHAAPGMGVTADSLGAPYPDTIAVDGGSPKGSQMDWTISNSRNTVDKK